MRTLIIDNYDSFTYNLFHMIAEVNGEAPVVIMNDEANWHIGLLSHFDNVVISPGPGHPARNEDFGICREVIAHAKIPVLGVCLGHQGIALHEGARVDLAPEPRHGRLSIVRHNGADILRDLPSPFSVVRYHSLAVTELPPALEAIAHSEDGVLMAVRHRERPVWGVQFHPESICSEHGTRIMKNFAALTRQWQQDGRCPAATGALPSYLATQHRFDHASAAAKAISLRVKMSVLTKKIPAMVPAEHVFEALFRTSKHAFWLDSSLTSAPFGRFSFMGDASGPLARVATCSVPDGTVTIESAANGRGVVRSGFFDWLAADLARFEIDMPDLPFEFSLGWVGYLGYELKAECYADAAHRSEHPDAAMIFADRAIAFDHVEGSVYLMALADPDDTGDAEQWLGETAAAIASLVSRSRRIPPSRPCELHDGELTLRHNRPEYLDLVARSKEAIVAGETYEVCLTNMITAGADVDPWSTYCLLRRNNPAPFAAYLQLDRLNVLSGSPERFLSISSDGLVESKPIKGTRPRGRTAEEDRKLKDHLRGSEKDCAENLMIVDLIRNDLGTCAETGSVSVPRLFDIESYATVHQMVSTIRATLRQSVSAVDCVRAAFPGGSMTGAPKIRTMQILDQLEGRARGIYSGSIGYFSLSGAVDLNIVIRTMVVSPGEISFGVGGAITALSDAADEFEETAVKATSLLRLFGAQFPGRALVSS